MCIDLVTEQLTERTGYFCVSFILSTLFILRSQTIPHLISFRIRVSFMDGGYYYNFANLYNHDVYLDVLVSSAPFLVNIPRRLSSLSHFHLTSLPLSTRTSPLFYLRLLSAGLSHDCERNESKIRCKLISSRNRG